MSSPGKVICHPGSPIEIKHIPPNPDCIRLMVLFLEKYELLTYDERLEMMFAIKQLNHPLVLVENPI